MMPRSKKLRIELRVHRGVVVHLVDERADFLDGEVADALLEHLLFFGESRKRTARYWQLRFGGHFEASRWKRRRVCSARRKRPEYHMCLREESKS